MREEGGVDVDLIEPLGDVRYHYRRGGALVDKRVQLLPLWLPVGIPGGP